MNGSTLEPLQSALLSGQPQVQHGFFTRHGGVSQGLFSSLNGSLSQDTEQAVFRNRQLVGKHLGSDQSALFVPRLCHSAKVVFVDKESLLVPAPEADGVVTTTRKLAIGVLDADCAPVLLADTNAGVVGAAHAGWRGALNGVLDNTVNLMVQHGAELANIRAAIGPCIQQSAYEVGPEFMESFVANDPDNEALFKVFEEGGRPYFDLSGYVLKRLERLKIGQCERSNVCTMGDERFFSYRRSRARGEQGFGCQISAIMFHGPSRMT